MHPLTSSRKMTWLCYAAMMSLAIGLNLLPVFLTSLKTSFGPEILRQEELGRLGAVAFAGVVIGILITGPMADRWGFKPFAQLGNGLIALSLIAMSQAPSYLLLGVALFFMGLGGGILDMVLSPIVSALNPERRSASLNWLHSFYCVGAVVTILAGTLALEAGLSWRSSCLLLLPLPLYLIAAFSPLHFPETVPEAHRVGLRVLAKQDWFKMAALAIFMGGATELGMAQWLPAYTETGLGYPMWMGGAGLLLFSLAMAAGRMAVGACGNKIDPYLIMAWSCFFSVILFLCGSFLPSPAWAFGACIAAGFAGSALWPTMLAVTANEHPTGGASMFGALAAIGNAGGIFMPWVVGWVSDQSNLHWGLAVSALAPLFMLPMVLWLRNRSQVRNPSAVL